MLYIRTCSCWISSNGSHGLNNVTVHHFNLTFSRETQSEPSARHPSYCPFDPSIPPAKLHLDKGAVCSPPASAVEYFLYTIRYVYVMKLTSFTAFKCKSITFKVGRKLNKNSISSGQSPFPSLLPFRPPFISFPFSLLPSLTIPYGQTSAIRSPKTQ